VKNRFIYIFAIMGMAFLLSACSNLAGTWRLQSPEIHEHTVSVQNLGDNRYYLSADGEKFSGVYRLEKSILILEKPEFPRLTGYRWRWDGKRTLTLLDEPTFSVAGQRYMPATLKKP